MIIFGLIYEDVKCERSFSIQFLYLPRSEMADYFALLTTVCAAVTRNILKLMLNKEVCLHVNDFYSAFFLTTP